MDKFEILNILEDNGFKAYIVGGYVRDSLLNINSFDIDIATSAKPHEVTKLLGISSKDNFGCITLTVGKYTIDITTFRKESNYDNRRPSEIEFVENLEEDLKRRDFTINAICMNRFGDIIDPLKGRKALENKTIEVIGDVETKFTEDPLRILRAVRFATTYDFKMSQDIIDFIKKHQTLVARLSYERKKTELDKIFQSKNAKKGLDLLKSLDLLRPLEIDYKESFIYVANVLGCWAEIQFADKYPFTKKERSAIVSIRKIVDKKFIDKDTLFEYGLEFNEMACEIMGIAREKISKIYETMPIKNERELKISSEEIKGILDGETSKIKEVKKDLINRVLSGKLTNSVEHLKEYIIENWK